MINRYGVPFLLGGAIAVLGLAGCASPQKSASSSGKPEITIRGVTRQQVCDALRERLFSRGWALGAANDRAVTASKPMANDAAGILNAPTVRRVSYDLLDSRGGVRVVAKLETVTNPGKTIEQVTDAIDTESGANIRDFLQQLSAELSRK
jgi:hypothetical protein